MNIADLLTYHFPRKLASNPAKYQAIGVTFQINITGPGGGAWNIDATPTGPRVVLGVGPADVAITISEPDAQKLLQNPALNSVALFFSGRLKVTGNKMLAMKLHTLFS